MFFLINTLIIIILINTLILYYFNYNFNYYLIDSVEKVTYGNIKMQVWDLGGQTSLRPYWRSFYGSNCAAIIYVIDSADKERLGIAKQELFAMLDEPELKDSILLVFANKQDLSGAFNEKEISERLGLSKIKNRTWTIVKTSVLKGTGLEEGMGWLVDRLKER